MGQAALDSAGHNVTRRVDSPLPVSAALGAALYLLASSRARREQSTARTASSLSCPSGRRRARGASNERSNERRVVRDMTPDWSSQGLGWMLRLPGGGVSSVSRPGYRISTMLHYANASGKNIFHALSSLVTMMVPKEKTYTEREEHDLAEYNSPFPIVPLL